MTLLDPSFAGLLRTLVTAPVSRLFDPAEQTWWPTYAGALVLAVCAYLWQRRGRKSGLRGLGRFLWPATLLKRPSVRLDVKLYLFNSAALLLQGLWLVGGDAMSDRLVTLLHLGAHPRPLGPVALFLVPIGLYLAIELGYWLSHFMLHRLPWLWEFHKVHHSAEVLTPLAELRQHPVESLLVGLVCGTAYALALTGLKAVFGPHLDLLAFWRPGVILFLVFATYMHLRHSHVRLGAPAWLSHIIQTPLQHQVHHSTDPRHFDRNLGFCLSVFDWAFGTLYVPTGDERLDFGVHDDDGAPDELMASTRLVDHLWRPFARAFGRSAPTAGETPAVPAE